MTGRCHRPIPLLRYCKRGQNPQMAHNGYPLSLLVRSLVEILLSRIPPDASSFSVLVPLLASPTVGSKGAQLLAYSSLDFSKTRTWLENVTVLTSMQIAHSIHLLDVDHK
jgi:hypothetical protein